VDIFFKKNSYKPFVALFIVLFVVRFFGYLAFHTVAEIFSIFVCLNVFILSLRYKNEAKSGFFIAIGAFYFSVALLDTLHFLSYKGMGVFYFDELNIATQFWVAARLTEGFGYVISMFYAGKKASFKLLLSVGVIIFIMFSGIIIFTDLFPAAYIQEEGLTGFKIYAEYFVVALILTSLTLIFKLRNNFCFNGFLLLVLSLVMTGLSELCFTLYHDVYGAMNMTGHILKVISFYFVYIAFNEEENLSGQEDET